MKLKRLWRNHSLTIYSFALGVVLFARGISYVWPLDEERLFDIFTSLGVGLLTIAILYTLAGVSRETNKPED